MKAKKLGLLFQFVCTTRVTWGNNVFRNERRGFPHYSVSLSLLESPESHSTWSDSLIRSRIKSRLETVGGFDSRITTDGTKTRCKEKIVEEVIDPVKI